MSFFQYHEDLISNGTNTRYNPLNIWTVVTKIAILKPFEQEVQIK